MVLGGLNGPSAAAFLGAKGCLSSSGSWGSPSPISSHKGSLVWVSAACLPGTGLVLRVAPYQRVAFRSPASVRVVSMSVVGRLYAVRLQDFLF